MTDLLHQISTAATIAELKQLMYKAETGEQHAAIAHRESQILRRKCSPLGANFSATDWWRSLDSKRRTRP